MTNIEKILSDLEQNILDNGPRRQYWDLRDAIVLASKRSWIPLGPEKLPSGLVLLYLVGSTNEVVIGHAVKDKDGKVRAKGFDSHEAIYWYPLPEM